MNRTHYIKGAFYQLIKKPKSILKLLQDGEYFKRMTRSKHNISQLPTIDLLDLFNPFEEETIENYTYLESTSWVTDIILLKKFARHFKDCQYFEIGSWRGESLYNVAQVAHTCYSLSLSAHEMNQRGWSKGFGELTHFFSKDLKNVTFIRHDSMTYDFSQIGKKFDLIYIDGDHTYEGIVKDTTNVFRHLKKENSVIVWNDYGRFSEKVRYEVLAAILDGVPAQEHKKLYHISNTLCAVYLPDKTYPTSFIKYPSRPNKVFTIRVKSDRL